MSRNVRKYIAEGQCEAPEWAQSPKRSTEKEDGEMDVPRGIYICPRCQTWKDGAEKAKAHLELRLARYVKAKTKGFCKYISSENKAEENDLCGP